MQRLQVEYIDLFYAHRPDKNTPIEETVWAMNHLLQQGKILYWGTSEWSAQEIMEAHMFAKDYNLIGPTMEQPQYNMFVRNKVEVEFSQIYKTVGLGTTIWSPLASGLLTEKYFDSIPSDSRMNREELGWLKEKTLLPTQIEKAKKINEIAQRLGVSLAQLGIAWCAQNPNVSTVILGASRLSQLKENLEAIHCVELMTEEVNKQIEMILDNKPIAPQY